MVFQVTLYEKKSRNADCSGPIFVMEDATDFRVHCIDVHSSCFKLNGNWLNFWHSVMTGPRLLDH